MRLGYYWLSDNLPFSKHSTKVEFFFKELVEKNMIVFSKEEKVIPLNYVDLPSTSGFKDKAVELGLSIKEFVRYLLQNPDAILLPKQKYYNSIIKHTSYYRAAVFAKRHFYNDLFESKVKRDWCFVENQPAGYALSPPKNIKVLSFEKFLDVNNKSRYGRREYNLTTNQLIPKEEFIKKKLKKSKFNLDWFFPLLEENTIIKGFQISETPYTNKHQNLFQKKIKLSSTDSEPVNSFLLVKTDNKKDELFLDFKRSFNPNKFRLVLKSHKEDRVVGIIPLKISIDGKKELSANDHINIPASKYEVGHIKFNKIKNIDFINLSDYHLNNLEIKGWSSLPDKTSISLDVLNKIVEKTKKNYENKMIPVTVESYFRVKFRSFKPEKYNCLRVVFSIIGNSLARDFKKTKTGLKSYFGDIKIPFDFLEDNYDENQLNCINTPVNFYQSTHTSKKGGLYIKVLSWKFVSNDSERESFESLLRRLSEKGYTLKEVEEKWKQKEADRIAAEKADIQDYYYNKMIDDYDPWDGTDAWMGHL